MLLLPIVQAAVNLTMEQAQAQVEITQMIEMQINGKKAQRLVSEYYILILYEINLMIFASNLIYVLPVDFK